MNKTLKYGILLVAVLLCWCTLNAQDAEIEKRIEDLLSKMTMEEKVDMIGGYEAFYIRPNKRLGIPKIKMADGPLGVRNYGPATAFPAGIALAASWNTDLMNRFGHAVGKECRSKGVHIMLAPGVNIYRAPMCGRNFEYYGEDPYLASRMTVAYVSGIQDEGVIATVKHFAANNQEFDRHTVSSDVDERTLHEIYLPAFRAAVEEANIGAVMTAYNLVNGVHCSQSEHLILDILKGQWQFDGFVMSDWSSTYDAVAAANAGLDLEMPSGAFMNRKNMIPAIREGKVKISTINDKIRRMLRVMLRMGFFDRPQQDDSLPLYSHNSSLVALQAAREGIVLLKNRKHLLPLDRTKIKSMAIIGPNAHPAVTGGGGSSRVRPFRSVSFLEGFISQAGDNIAVHYTPGVLRNYDEFFTTSKFFTPSQEHPEKELLGLRVDYFSNVDLSGPPVKTRIDRQVHFRWRREPLEGLSSTNFSARWTGKIKPEKTGVHTFIVHGDDGYRLFVNGKLVINAWSDQAPTTRKVTVPLKADTPSDIILEYYQNEGGAEIHLGWFGPDISEMERALKLAAQSDVAVLCVGYSPETESEGGDRTFTLPPGQVELIYAVAEVNTNTIVVLTAGGNVNMSGWLEHVPVLLHTWYPGQEGGTALAEIIFGGVSPSGKLPATFEKQWRDNPVHDSYHDDDGDKSIKYKEGIFVGYRHYDKHQLEPLFPFGFGISYTDFKYSNLNLSTKKLKGGKTFTVSVDITNIGNFDGKEVVQLYIQDVQSSVLRPPKELKGFVKVDLKSGEKKTVQFTLSEKDLSFYDVNKRSWTAEPGTFNILIGSSSRDIRLKDSIVLK